MSISVSRLLTSVASPVALEDEGRERAWPDAGKACRVRVTSLQQGKYCSFSSCKHLLMLRE